VDGGPVINASRTRVHNPTLTEVSFHASVQVTGGPDPHTVTVTATDDQGISVTQTRHVFAGTPFAVDAPAVVVDILSPEPINEFLVLGETQPIQKALAGLSASLATIGKIIAGPNFQFFNSSDPRHSSRMRIGFWIEDASFPVVKRKDLPLPILSDQSAALGFALAPPVPVPDVVRSFGVSVPLGTLQKLVDAAAPDIRSAASDQGVSLDSITVQTTSPESVTTRFTGSLPLGVPFDLSVTEVLGLKQRPDATPLVPAVVSSSHSSGLGSVIDLIIAAILKPFRAVLAIEFLELRSTANSADQQITGLMQSLVAGIPPTFPFRNTLLPFDVSTPPEFPAIVLFWSSFAAAKSGILGSGDLSIEARNQDEVSLSIDGPNQISGNEGELAGNVQRDYSFTLGNLAPDADKFTWHVSGGSGTRSGSIESNFGLGGTFTVDFPLPLHAVGKFGFTLTVTATETCGTDSTKTLNASTSMAVVFEIKHVVNPQLKRTGGAAG
jgi:hypothetical protein